MRSNQIFDVFIIHTGCNKNFVAKPLKTILEEFNPDSCVDEPYTLLSEPSCLTQTSSRSDGPLRCFLDAEMKNYNGYTHSQMESALETCRYAVVILTPPFLKMKHPCAELKYAFQREEILYQKYHWHSLYIILHMMSVEDYETHCAENPHQNLPQITKKQVLILSSNFDTQDDLFRAVKEMILESDRRGAKEDWGRFLEARTLHANRYDQIPLAKDIYAEGCGAHCQVMHDR